MSYYDMLYILKLHHVVIPQVDQVKHSESNPDSSGALCGTLASACFQLSLYFLQHNVVSYHRINSLNSHMCPCI